MCVQYQKVKLERHRRPGFGQACLGPQLDRLRERGFLARCWRCSVPWSGSRSLPNMGRAPDLFTQQVCRVGLDLAIQRGSAEEPAHRRRHLSSGEPGRARVSRCGPAGDSSGTGRFGGARWQQSGKGFGLEEERAGELGQVFARYTKVAA